LENKLDLDPELVGEARRLAAGIAARVQEYVRPRTTVAVERAVLRLMGVGGVDEAGVPLPNRLVDQLRRAGSLARGAALPLAAAVYRHGLPPGEAAREAGRGRIRLDAPADEGAVRETAARLARDGLARIDRARRERERLLARLGQSPPPLLYAIVATGNIYEDLVQARAAAGQGADIIAVIRSTGQSLLDYVPFGPTTEGFGGTYATRANFRLMREALDEEGERLGRYIMLTNYASGLCMPEIAALGAQERLDVMLNDAMYGIIFRDINMRRTFVDQHFSRVVSAYGGLVINTGEDNYLTTADAVEAAHTVLASQFVNEQLALAAGLVPEQIGLGHAFEMDPGREDGFLWELAQARMVREIFPASPVKYMPPTKFMTGNIFQGHVQDALFNVASVMSGQTIHLLGMPTEAIHTPLLADRYLAITCARYIFRNLRHLGEEISFRPGGRIQERARGVLRDAVDLLRRIDRVGLMEALHRGMFAGVSRSPEGGRGRDGVLEKGEGYWNPFLEPMRKGADVHAAG